MAHIDETGLLWENEGDVLRVTHLLRVQDYGPLLTPRPLILVWHLTGNRIPEGANAASTDGTNSMASRVADGTARYYAHLYLGRDGAAVQTTNLLRSAIHVAGRWQGYETNRISTGIEVTNAGYTKLDQPESSRRDYRVHGRLAWQMLTAEQQTAMLELAEAWQVWAGAAPEDCIRGHHDVDPNSSHVDPGPEEGAFLRGPVLARLQRRLA